MDVACARLDALRRVARRFLARRACCSSCARQVDRRARALDLARAVVDGARARARVIVNDRADVAARGRRRRARRPGRSAAPDARRSSARRRWVGLSTHTLEQIDALARAHRLSGVGPVFGTAPRTPATTRWASISCGARRAARARGIAGGGDRRHHAGAAPAVIEAGAVSGRVIIGPAARRARNRARAHLSWGGCARIIRHASAVVIAHLRDNPTGG